MSTGSQNPDAPRSIMARRHGDGTIPGAGSSALSWASISATEATPPGNLSSLQIDQHDDPNNDITVPEGALHLKPGLYLLFFAGFFSGDDVAGANISLGVDNDDAPLPYDGSARLIAQTIEGGATSIQNGILHVLATAADTYCPIAVAVTDGQLNAGAGFDIIRIA